MLALLRLQLLAVRAGLTLARLDRSAKANGMMVDGQTR